MSLKHQAAVQMWTGQMRVLIEQVISYVQRSVNLCRGCGSCGSCLRITQRQSHYMYWSLPGTNGYTREQVDEMLFPLQFTLDTHEKRFLIIEAAEQMLAASANSLLKTLEEPPLGWYIILLTERPQSLLATIRSRCVEYAVADQLTMRDEFQSPALAWLCNPTPAEWNAAFASVETLKKSAMDVTSALDQILLVWKDRLHSEDRTVSAQVENIINVLLAAYDQLPGPGGAVSFWRSVLLAVRREL